MLCQKCQKKQATTHYQQTVNGETTEYHVCSDCAKELGLLGNVGFSQMFSPFDLHFGDLFSGMFGAPTGPQQLGGASLSTVCPKCGVTLREIMDSGRLGCNECYRTFYRELAPSIEKIHGKATHSGKVPRSAGAALQNRRKAEQLKAELAQAIREENFEKAAGLRDQIKALESEGNCHE